MDGPPSGEAGGELNAQVRRPNVSKGSKTGQSRNDQRSNSKNPNNAAHHARANNTSDQGNPNNPAYASSRGKTFNTTTEGSSEASKE